MAIANQGIAKCGGETSEPQCHILDAGRSQPVVHSFGNVFLYDFGDGPVIGGAIGWFGGRLIDRAVKRNWMEPVFQRLSSISLV